MADISSQLKVLREAIRAVPSVKFALGLAGVAAAAAISVLFFTSLQWAVLAIIIFLALMFILFLFSMAVAHGVPGSKWILFFLCWAISILFVAVLVLLILSFFLCSPLSLGSTCGRPDGRLAVVAYELLDDTPLVKESDGKICLLDIRPRRSNTYRVQKIGDLAIPIVVVVDGFKRESSGAISLATEFSILDGKQTQLASVTSKPFASDDAWKAQPMISCVQPISAFDKIPHIKKWLSKGAVPFVATLKCFGDKEINFGENVLRMTARDGIASESAMQSMKVYIEKTDTPGVAPLDSCH